MRLGTFRPKKSKKKKNTTDTNTKGRKEKKFRINLQMEGIGILNKTEVGRACEGRTGRGEGGWRTVQSGTKIKIIISLNLLTIK